MNWTVAHRMAAIAASNLRNRLGLAEDGFVDVFAALRASGLTVVGRPMSELFGMYLPSQPGRDTGILLNSRMSETTIRHSAAHELGHAEMGHTACVAEDLDSLAPAQWTDDEKQAEAFAAWFLMPVAAVKSNLSRLGLDTPRQAMDAYQLSLHLGTSYRGTVRHLMHLRMLPRPVGNGWVNVSPARLRAQLCGGPTDLPARVWDLSGLTGDTRLPIERGDRLILRAPWLNAESAFTAPDGVVLRAQPLTITGGDVAEFDIDDDIDTEFALTMTASGRSDPWSVTLMPTPRSHLGLIADGRGPLRIGPARRRSQ